MSDDGLRAIRGVVVDEIERIAGVRRRLGRAEGLQRADREPRRRARAAGAQVPRHAARLRRAQRQLGLAEPAAAARALARGRASRWCSSPSSRASRALLASDRNVWREALARWKITGVVPYVVGAPAERRADRARAGRARGAARRGDRAAEAPLRHDRRPAGAGAPCRRRRRRAGAHRQGHQGAADALRQVAADDARRRPAVRVGRAWPTACRWSPRASTA